MSNSSHGFGQITEENNESAPAAPALAVPPPGSGSRGHPALCRRPCIRLAKGSCDMGDASWTCCWLFGIFPTGKSTMLQIYGDLYNVVNAINNPQKHHKWVVYTELQMQKPHLVFPCAQKGLHIQCSQWKGYTSDLCNCRCKCYTSDLCNCWCNCHTSDLCNCWCKSYISDLCNCWCKRYTSDLCSCWCKWHTSDLCNCWCKCYTSDLCNCWYAGSISISTYLCNCWCKRYTSDLCNCWCKRYTFDLCICWYAGNIGIWTVYTIPKWLFFIFWGLQANRRLVAFVTMSMTAL